MKKIYAIDGEKIKVCNILKRFKKNKEEYVQIKLNGELINLRVKDIPTSDKFKTDKKDAIIEMYKKVIKHYKDIVQEHNKFLDAVIKKLEKGMIGQGELIPKSKEVKK